MHPRWDEYFGSGGRAAAAIRRLDIPVVLHAYADDHAADSFRMRAALEDITFHHTEIPQTPGFEYVHGLATPYIRHMTTSQPSIELRSAYVLRFGMLEGEGIVHAARAVYDPQDAKRPQSFRANGSTADELALIVNRHEAALMLGDGTLPVEAMARALSRQESARVVVIKQGPNGALVLVDDKAQNVPAYLTSRVWKIGSGDNFAAHFAAAWLHDGLSAEQAADRASRATAYFCEHQGDSPTRGALEAYEPRPIVTGPKWRQGHRPSVYLAGPFFDLPQLWLIEQAREALRESGLRVFSPYHDVGRGSAEEVVDKDLKGIVDCDVVLALIDGLDPGTVYEVGYARALPRPVVIYSERQTAEDLKMMHGSACMIVDDFVSAIYQTIWVASRG
jgi:nucleoside 2-deoxyribosyltransferase/ATP-dependent protease HslVU (ClpYQ) peptidase subunit